VVVALGPGLCDPDGPHALERRVPAIRARLYADLGVRAPEVVVTPLPDAPERSYAVAVNGVTSRSGAVPGRDGWVAAAPAELAALGIAGPDVRGGDRRPRTWADAAALSSAERAGYETGDATAFVASELEWSLRSEAAEFLGVQEARELADGLEATHPALVQEVVPRLVSLAQVAEVLRRLTREGVSIRDLRSVFEALASAGSYDRDPLTLSEAVRSHLRRQLTERATGGRGSLPVYVLEPEAEIAFREAVAAGPGLDYVPLEPGVAREVLESLRRLDGAGRPASAPAPAVVVPREIRRAVRAVIEGEFPHVAVLAYQELMPWVALHPVGALGPAAPAGA
jgi:type III secretion protein V